MIKMRPKYCSFNISIHSYPFLNYLFLQSITYVFKIDKELLYFIFIQLKPSEIEMDQDSLFSIYINCNPQSYHYEDLFPLLSPSISQNQDVDQCSILNLDNNSQCFMAPVNENPKTNHQYQQLDINNPCQQKKQDDMEDQPQRQENEEKKVQCQICRKVHRNFSKLFMKLIYKLISSKIPIIEDISFKSYLKLFVNKCQQKGSSIPLKILKQFTENSLDSQNRQFFMDLLQKQENCAYIRQESERTKIKKDTNREQFTKYVDQYMIRIKEKGRIKPIRCNTKACEHKL